MGSYELYGEVGRATLRGIAVLFLMWNVTYPFVILHPVKNIIVYRIVLIQSLIGVLGESWILNTIREVAPVLAESIFRFVLFDGMGLLIMLIPYVIIQVSMSKMQKQIT